MKCITNHIFASVSKFKHHHRYQTYQLIQHFSIYQTNSLISICNLLMTTFPHLMAHISNYLMTYWFYYHLELASCTANCFIIPIHTDFFEPALKLYWFNCEEKRFNILFVQCILQLLSKRMQITNRELLVVFLIRKFDLYYLIKYEWKRCNDICDSLYQKMLCQLYL